MKLLRVAVPAAAVAKTPYLVAASGADSAGAASKVVASDGTNPHLSRILSVESMRTDATFVDIAEDVGLSYVGDSYAALASDVTGDGLPDVLVANRNREPGLALYQNESQHHGAWLKVQLEGAGLNRFGIGARVEVSVSGARQIQEMRAGEGLMSGSAPELLFGLGAAEKADKVTVHWPGGATSSIEDVSGKVTLREQN